MIEYFPFQVSTRKMLFRNQFLATI